MGDQIAGNRPWESGMKLSRILASALCVICAYWAILEIVDPIGAFSEKAFDIVLMFAIVFGIMAVHWGAGWFALACFTFGLYFKTWPPLPHGFDHLLGSTVALRTCLVAVAFWLVWFVKAQNKGIAALYNTAVFLFVASILLTFYNVGKAFSFLPPGEILPLWATSGWWVVAASGLAFLAFGFSSIGVEKNPESMAKTRDEIAPIGISSMVMMVGSFIVVGLHQVFQHYW